MRQGRGARWWRRHGTLEAVATRLLVLAAIALGVLGLVPAWLALAVVGGGVALMVFDIALTVWESKLQRQPTGAHALVGQVAVARTALAPEGVIFIRGERWNARLEEGEAAAGHHVQVVAARGLWLRVRRIA